MDMGIQSGTPVVLLLLCLLKKGTVDQLCAYAVYFRIYLISDLHKSGPLSDPLFPFCCLYLIKFVRILSSVSGRP